MVNPQVRINSFCSRDENSPNMPEWTFLDALKLKFPGSIGRAQRNALIEYKNSWVKFNKHRIEAVAKHFRIPSYLIASVAWAEVGGAPDKLDNATYIARSVYEIQFPTLKKQSFGPFKNSAKTSVGPVSIQLKNAAEDMGIKIDDLNLSERLDLVDCLQQDLYNLEIVARHLKGLIIFDNPEIDDTSILTEEQIIIVGARYNRGKSRERQDIVNSIYQKPNTPGREYSEYGRAMIGHLDEIHELLR